MNKNIFKKLDLIEYIENFNSFLSRPKNLYLDGDSKINYEQIMEFSKHEITPCENIAKLDDAIIRTSKFAVLHISEIYEFIKIIRYFNYIKKFNFDIRLKNWLDRIIIPEAISEILDYFDNKGELKDSIDERFFSLKEAYKIKKNEIDRELKKLIYSKSITPYLADTQIHYINENEALLVRGGFNHVLKGSVVARSSGGYFYVIPDSISKLKSEQSAISDKKEEIVYEYCKQISSTFNKNLPFLKFINKEFDKLDSLLARSFLAKAKDYDFVLSDNSRDIIIKEFAHPALNNAKRVSVDFTKKVLLVTGVNAGGKSMLLKSILSATLLSKYLLPMPIRSYGSKIGTFKEFETIMEDPQNVKNDISTFAGRMLGFSKLFNKNNLILGIDEIELGTDFEEAASLYSVLIKKLIAKDSKIVITTHHKRLAMLLAKNSEVELVAALYDEEKGAPKFEFLKGVIGKSYAFETALRYGINPNFVNEAKKLYGEDKENLNEVISKAINLELELKEKLQETKVKEQKLNDLLNSLKNQKEKIEKEQKLLISKLEIEYYRAIEEAKKTINLKDVKDKQRSINRANELKKQINKPESKSKVENFEVGDMVKYDKIKGKIITLSKSDAVILSDNLQLRVPIKLLKRSGNPTPAKKSSIKINVSKPKNASFTLDLHGLRAEEALEKLDKFISNSLVMGYDEVLIKHGVGTGKLAYAVKEFLKAHPSVKAFRDGIPSEGGYGSKVIKF
ncbi:DNA mismatch binding protein, MutS2 family [Campylobacter blaseri]|uniref:Endonuclease MutS2 n=1 Tax=Campylobacter blaseri TaxID=2042961 RepID=A0A2P8R0I6_9BACT|nr:endonuclease MutS2 [Campylobacter blaseri]PSM52000.1 endonuclease MutS2 [Campylobacter blaseri]PSM53785.1 endonuclease MutS2 [Campylobacter blaseri]QKF85663.1 DNA mismatch binding protein, MutS2 family [Campylobacter blaseri]